MRVTPGNGTKSLLTWPRAVCPPAPVSSPRQRLAAVAISAPLSSRFYSKNNPRAEIAADRSESPDSQFVIAKTARRRQLRRDRQLDDIVPGDLAATLEAHRKSNRRASFRAIPIGGRIRKYLANGPENLKIREVRQSILNAVASPDSVVSAPTSDLPDTLHVPSKRSRSERPLSSKIHYVKKSSRLEEKRKAHPPATSHRPHSYPVEDSPARFWENQETAAALDRRERLNIEIRNLANWIVPNADEHEFYTILGAYLCTVLRYKIHGASSFQTFGSRLTGLATATSDIDLKFHIESLSERGDQRGPSSSLGRPQNRKLVVNTLTQLSKFLSQQRKYGRCEVLDARIPILKFTHLESNAEVQLVYGNEQLEVADQVRAYIAEYPQIVPVYFLIKEALQARSLGSRQHGGVGSFPLLMMIVASFKHTKLSRRDDLVEALLSFLSFYETFDTSKYCISVDPPDKFAKRTPSLILSLQEKRARKNDPQLSAKQRLGIAIEERPWALCLQDPTDITNDLGRSCHKYLEIRSVISNFAVVTRSWLDGDPAPKASVHNPMFVFFENALGAIHNRRKLFGEFFASAGGQEEIVRMREYVDGHNSKVFETSQLLENMGLKHVADDSSAGDIFSKAYDIECQLLASMKDCRRILYELKTEEPTRAYTAQLLHDEPTGITSLAATN